MWNFAVGFDRIRKMPSDLHVNLKQQDVTEVERSIKTSNKGRSVTVECLIFMFIYLLAQKLGHCFISSYCY